MNNLSWQGLRAKRDLALHQRCTAGRDTLLSLTSASHLWKGYFTEHYNSVTPLEGILYWALQQRHTAGRDTLLSLTSASHRWKGYFTEHYNSITPNEGTRYWAVHKCHTGKLPSPPHITQHKFPHWYLACRVQVSDWKTDILTVFMVFSLTCR